MATRIRLQRHGKKGKPFYHLVAADSRAKRDGKFIEKLGTYNPNLNPAVIDIDFDRTLHWVQVGAEMSNTARAILSYKGILHKNHLLKGVEKGALTADQVETKFAAWVADKENKVQSKVERLDKESTADKSARLDAEKTAKDAKAAAIIAKNTPEPEVAEEAPVAEVAEEVVADAAPEVEAVVAEEAPTAPVEEAPAPEETPEEEEPKAE
ncbi:MAG: 30S ribosomal protein S16 [Crocinitomicaceae bacterium]|nr:30S ribosomal protein S16 [Crocinitomicaceae bacterium]